MQFFKLAAAVSMIFFVVAQGEFWKFNKGKEESNCKDACLKQCKWSEPKCPDGCVSATIE
jgi:hypothetical protein